MKRAVAAFLCLIIVLLSGCKVNSKDIISDINKKVNKILEKSSVAENFGILLDEDIKEKKIKRIKPAAVKEDGIKTLSYEVLNESQKDIYKIILSAADSMPEGWIYICEKNDDYKKDVSVAYKAVLCDNPRIFWMPLTYILAGGGKKVCVAFKIDEDDVKNDYIVSKTERDTMLPALDSVTDSIVNSALAFQSDFEKELFVHDYLCDNTVYKIGGGNMIYSSYGAIVDGICVCEGYSRAMQLIMQRLGIRCILVYGEHENEGHMWNLINLGGNWYHLDITWDKSEKFGTLHGYFNLTDNEILESHVISPSYENKKDKLDGDNYNLLQYKCSCSDYNYYNYLSLNLGDNPYENAKIIENAAKQGKKTIEFKNNMTGNVETILNESAKYVDYYIGLNGYSQFSQYILLFFENTY